MKYSKNIMVALLVIAFYFLAASSIHAATTTPTSYKFKVISFSLSTDAANCTNPTTVFQVEGDTDA